MRLFYVVDSLETNEEIFNDRKEALDMFDSLKERGYCNARIRICEVNNWYYDEILEGINYDNESDTFKTIKILRQEV